MSWDYTLLHQLLINQSSGLCLSASITAPPLFESHSHNIIGRTIVIAKINLHYSLFHNKYWQFIYHYLATKYTVTYLVLYLLYCCTRCALRIAKTEEDSWGILHAWRRGNAYWNFGEEILRVFEFLGIDEKIIFRYILWTVLFWLMTGTGCGLLWKRCWILVFHKMAQNMLGSWETASFSWRTLLHEVSVTENGSIIFQKCRWVSTKLHGVTSHNIFLYTMWFKYDRDWFVCKQAGYSPGRIWTTLYF